MLLSAMYKSIDLALSHAQADIIPVVCVWCDRYSDGKDNTVSTTTTNKTAQTGAVMTRTTIATAATTTTR